MSWTTVADLLGLVFLLMGAMLCLVAGIGLLRFPDLLTRMHAGTKPQVLGVLLVILGVGLRTRSGLDVGMLVLIGVFQLLTIPAGAHMVGRAGFRTGQVELADIHLGSRGRRLQPGAAPPGPSPAAGGQSGTGMPDRPQG
ncbi:hypothetical protein GCM10009584_31450 [Ornithinimicrobium humiphilum]|uniref:Multicomponent Na+:H+ antiporter subunit G n=1 Tax=Ornithinimicrobium humiphilum TaxID=125288 RepID=A0A543K5D8_9MICO|nr:monovalent cation/H(+) antiporter subunit G [Ornithinimicrobium humiphilum]TQM90291.1 multicomponent Na+:H+ antiporter subunit G [Ornithinimicrobium humiphilum]